MPISSIPRPIINNQTVSPYFGQRAVGRESIIIRDNLSDVYRHITEPISGETDAQKFLSLALTWKKDTELASLQLKSLVNPSYLRIISMGKEVLPFIFNDLTDNNNLWFAALRVITGIDPVPDSDKGDIQKMKYHWLSWGKNNGYIA